MRDHPDIYNLEACLERHEHELAIRHINHPEFDVEQMNKAGHTPLIVAVTDGCVPVIKALIEKGANVNATTKLKQTPLMFAASYENLGAIDTLLRAGAKINQADKDGDTPLICAATRDNPKVIAKLLIAGADINHRTKYRETALSIAITNGCVHNAKILIERGAKVNLQNRNGDTPLIMASKLLQTVTIDLLRQAGADATITNNLNMQAIDYADMMAKEIDKVLELLVKPDSDFTPLETQKVIQHNANNVHYLSERRASKLEEETEA